MPIPMRSLALAAWIMFLPAGVIPAAPAAEPAAASDIKFAFKLDPRLAGGTYGGERWVSPPTYTGISGQNTVEVRAKVLDAAGRPMNISPKWIPDNPAIVSVSPGQGSRVEIRVQRAGESKLKVAAPGFSRELSIKATHKNDAMRVEIAQVKAEAPAKAADAGEAPAFKSEKDRLSYALGSNVSNSLRKQSIEVDSDLLIQGFKDATSGGKTLLTEDEVRAILRKLQSELKTKQAALQAEQKRVLAEKNKKDGEAFLAENQSKEGVVILESGLQYKVLKAGDGQKPTADDTVVSHYRGTLIDGTEFDSSYKRNQPATFPLKKVIKGWSEALQLMPVGSKWQLFVPSDLGYGARGAPRGKIGPNATLIFEVELLSIKARDRAANDGEGRTRRAKARARKNEKPLP